MLFISRLETSTYIVDCRWYIVLTLCLKSYLYRSVSNWWLKKFKPPSLMMALGVLNLVKICFLKNVVMFLPHYWIKLLPLTTWTHNRLQVGCIIFPKELEKGPMKSILQTSNNSISGICHSGNSCLLEILPCIWHWTQHLQKVWGSINIVGQ